MDLMIANVVLNLLGNEWKEESSMRLKGKKVVLLAENHYEDLELWVPYYRLKEEGAEVTIVGTGSSQTYTSKHGYPVEVR